MWLGHSLLMQGHGDEAEDLLRAALPVAAAIGDREPEGFMRMSLASADLSSGRSEAARSGYETARGLLRESGNLFGELDALTGLGRAHQQLGDLDRARACYEEVAERACVSGLRENEADALNNLGVNEFLRGDPAVAVEHLRAALRMRVSLGNPFHMIVPAANVARALSQLGRFDEAESCLDSLLVLCQEQGYADQQAQVLEALASLCRERGDPAGALELHRRIIGFGESATVFHRIDGYTGAADALAAMDRADEAVALLEGPARRLCPSLPADQAMELDWELSECLLEAGRLEDAIASALRTDREAENLDRPAHRVAALTVAATAEIRLGRSADAGRHLDLATGLWERVRQVPTDLEWRERRAVFPRLHTTAVGWLLGAGSIPPGPDRIGAAFDAAQRFKTRTLLERVQRSRADVPAPTPPATLQTLQREVLRGGEVLVDFLVGDEVSYVFAVTRESCSVESLPGTEELASRLHRFRDFLATPVRQESTGSASSYRAAAGEIGALLLGPVAPALAGADRIYVAPDGPLYSVPFDALRLPGIEGEDDDESEPLGFRSVVSRVPSAALLVLVRSRDRAPTQDAPFRGLAVAGASAPGSPALRGARKEVDRLGRIAGMRVGPDRTDIPAESTARSLLGYSLLHFAGHTELNDQYPWRSAVVLQPSGKERGAVVVRAEEIAALALDAGLVVLSGCESAGGSAIRGEGLQGLSSAFLAAGTQALVATLWPVDDEATALLMARFYDGLERGATAGEALRQAKRSLASSPRFAPPFFWAGVLLIGDPDLRVDLRPDRSVPRTAWVAGGSLLVLAIALAIADSRRRARRPRVTPTPAERQSP
jgi:CHAT domain-containing protein/tetratricopeptide (TPR) repeat protein